MPFFQTNKNKFLESKICEAYDTLENPKVARRLGGRAEVLRSTLDDVYIPNIRFGRVARMPVNLVDTDATPLVLLDCDKTIDISASNADFSMTQRERIAEELRILGILDSDNERAELQGPPKSDQIVPSAYWDGFSKREIFTSRKLTEHSAAAVIANFVPVTYDYQTYEPFTFAQTRPAIIMRYHKNIPIHALPHELVHVSQGHNTALRSMDQINDPLHQLSLELEAYHVSACVLRGLKIVRGVYDPLSVHSPDVALDVEGVRSRLATRGRPFVANESIVNELDRLNLSDIYGQD